MPSPAIWKDCNWLDMERADLSRLGQGPAPFFDDFTKLPLAPTLTTQIAYGQYKAFATSSSTITAVSAVNSVDLGGGIAQFLVDASTHSASLGDSYPGPYKITGDPATSDKLWFECRIALGLITTLHAGLFVGLAETSLFTLATAVPFTSNAGTAIDASGAMIGFNKTAAQTSLMHTVTSDRATSFTVVGSGEVTGVAANVFTKLGILYDPRARDGRNVRFFQDNVECATALKNSDITTSTNLKANSLGLLIAVVGGSAASNDKVFLDWWRVAQQFPA